MTTEGIKGLILLNIELGLEDKVVGDAAKIEGVREAFSVYGAHDAVVLFQLEGREKLNALVSRLRRMNGLTRTVTLVAI